MSNINKITCVCETCISAVLLKYSLNEWCLTTLAQLYKFLINAVATMILQKYKKDYIE